jgi:hypothetical protein
MGKLVGTVSITGLPPHRGVMVAVCFYRVESEESPAPHGGDPPTEAATDCEKIYSQVHFDTESKQGEYEFPFSVERPSGHYYLEVRAILFRVEEGKMDAQFEPYFYGRRPLQITDGTVGPVTLPVVWPATALGDLHTHGVINPRKPKDG